MSKSRSGASKRMAAGLLAGAVSVFGLALASPAGAVDDVSVERLAGATRYGTAAAIAGEDPPGAFEGADTAILATGENFPDALAASGLAGSEAPAPILLTRTATLSPEALAALDELAVDNVIIVGGTAAVSDDVQGTLEDEGYTVSRVAGTNRYATAAEIADEVGAPADGTVLIATGTNYPDALAGGPLAYAGGHPILLVTPNDIPAETEAALADADNAIILGGTAAVSNEVQAEIDDITGGDSTRLAGVNRFETAEAVADYLLANEAAFDGKEVILASGLNFPDALAGGPLGGELGAPIILTGSCPSADWLDAHSSTIENIWALGGTAAQSDETLDECEAAAEDTDGDTPTGTGVTSQPELIGAKVVSVVTQGVNTGTTVRYTFDDIVVAGLGPAGAAGFHVVTQSGTRTNGTSQKQGPDLTSIDVLFTTLNSQALADAQTVATVDRAAAQDNTGDLNPEGDAALAVTTGTTLVAGQTSAPDLTAVGNFRAATTTLTAVDWTFDEAVATINNPNGFILITTTGVGTFPAQLCTFDSKSADNLVITTVCPNVPPGSTTPLNPLFFARGFVAADSVRDAGGDGNPDGAADITGGNTGVPDVVSASIAPNGTLPDTMTVVFDQNVSSPPAAGGFVAYRSNSNQVAAPTSAATSGTTPTQVLLTYPDGTLSDVVGIAVYPGAVTAGDGANQGQPNLYDEVGVANTAAAATSGRTDDPDLIGVTRTPAVDIFNNPTGGFFITYTFDEDVATATAANFFAYDANGTRYVATNCQARTIGNGGTEDTDATVRCTAYSNATTLVAATNAQVQGLVLGTVETSAVTAETGGNPNNAEGAEKIA